MTRNEAVSALAEAQKKLAKAETKEETLKILADAGKAAGYTPAFRALVAGQEAEKSVRWKDKE